MPSRRESLSSNQEDSQCRWTFSWPRCGCFFAIFTSLVGLFRACVQRVPLLRRVSSSTLILPTGSQTARRRCATWSNWCWRKCKCTCTSPTCRMFRYWRKNWKKLPRRCFRRMRRCRWPKWEPDQNSLWVRVIKASRLDGFKMAVKDKMHFAGRVMYVVTYKLFTGFAIYLIIVSSVKILKTPIIYKYAGKVPVENIVFPGIDVCPSNLFPKSLLQESNSLYLKANVAGSTRDTFGELWSLAQAAKLYYYVFKQCQTARSHSQFFGFSYTSGNLTGFKNYKNSTLRDDTQDEDFQKILQLIKKHGGTVDCSKMLAACRWGPNKNWNCSDIFQVVETETGQCCRLNPIDEYQQVIRNRSKTDNLQDRKWNIDEYNFVGDTSNQNKWMKGYQRYQKVAGSNHGLTLVLIMETENVACPTNAGNAYMIYVHSALDAPQTLENGIFIEPNHEIHINVIPDVTLTDKQIISLPVDTRQCYFQEENFLNSTSYTENNCRMECRSLLFQQNCKCHKVGATAGKNEVICGPQHTQCEERLEKEIQEQGYAHMCMGLEKPMKCFRGCTDIEYSTVVTSTSYFGTPALVKNMNLKTSEATAIVRIFFGSDTAIARERQLQYDFWETIGILGGILGLFIGFDFMQIIHLAYAWGIWIKGLRLKWKLANSAIGRSIVNVHSMVDAVNTVSTQTPVDSRLHCLDFAKRKNFKRVVIKRRGQIEPAIPLEPVAPTDLANSIVNPIAEFTITNETETVIAGPSQRKVMADVVRTNELIKNMFAIQKRRVSQVEQYDQTTPVHVLDETDLVPSVDSTDAVTNSGAIGLVDRITHADIITLINSLVTTD